MPKHAVPFCVQYIKHRTQDTTATFIILFLISRRVLCTEGPTPARPRRTQSESHSGTGTQLAGESHSAQRVRWLLVLWEPLVPPLNAPGGHPPASADRGADRGAVLCPAVLQSSSL